MPTLIETGVRTPASSAAGPPAGRTGVPGRGTRAPGTARIAGVAVAGHAGHVVRPGRAGEAVALPEWP
ncbi:MULTISPECIES: hypothetical protein [Amycolatopsis]|uniref:Uncharacterized protein n=1 Tax=Amycolatopsis rubida TaxID=112413 RepID=A0A1I5L5D9_9PSEU|nr:MULTISPECIES: hypothetical protein [Amycolatopsis]OAP25239.1 hypothetical protein A4R44_03622 [Amycolatopsis sp. M39]SFO92418.1 hypothetical protein SAMN05421854_103450 [Amycolatopsis rubida]